MKRQIIPYNPHLKDLARQLRNSSTKAEIILWQKLKRKQLYGYDFHRQKPIDNFILDFFCNELMLGIEVDGYSHDFLEVYEKDLIKEKRLSEFGITVLRFSDTQVLKDTENVVRAIEHFILEFEGQASSGRSEMEINKHTPNPSQEGNINTQTHLTMVTGYMTTPPFLKPNDKVGVIATAKRTEPEEIEFGLQTLKSWGLIPIIGDNTFKADGFLAGTDDERAADLQLMLDDPDIRAIFFTKGGYGTLRIIDRIDWTKFRQNPKWLVGYSDITLLHCHVHNFGIQSLHAVMLQGYFKSTTESVESIRKALFGEGLTYTFPAASDNRSGEAVNGQLVGGNLSMLYAITGSDSDIDTRGKILFIEDIDEYLYHYDRMLLSLKRAGKLAGLKAIILGSMVDIKESTISFGRDERQMTLEHTAEYGYPVIFDFPAGHVSDNLALLFGAELTITPNNHNVTIDFSYGNSLSK